MRRLNSNVRQSRNAEVFRDGCGRNSLPARLIEDQPIGRHQIDVLTEQACCHSHGLIAAFVLNASAT